MDVHITGARPRFRLANKGTVTFTREQFWNAGAWRSHRLQVSRSWSTWNYHGAMT